MCKIEDMSMGMVMAKWHRSTRGCGVHFNWDMERAHKHGWVHPWDQVAVDVLQRHTPLK